MDLQSQHCYLVGMKGSGMASLAVLLARMGCQVRGCDRDEVFFTDALLKQEGLVCDLGFSDDLLTDDISLVIYSSAYPLQTPILQAAARRELALYSYPAFIAYLTRRQDSYAVAGTHGKSTTCSVASHLLREASDSAFPFYAVYGSSQAGQEHYPYYGGACALFEACEYQDHFLSYDLRSVLITSIEFDHPDYFHSLKEVKRSFEALVDRLKGGGIFIYCADDEGACELAAYAAVHRPDLTILSYGFSAKPPFRILQNGPDSYTLAVLPQNPFTVQAKARALVCDHIGALVLSLAMLLDRPKPRLYIQDQSLITDEILPTLVSNLSHHLGSYTACTGRTEVLLQQDGVVYIDDYAHHPSEIRTSLEELGQRYPRCKILVIFCPHTASRTRAFFEDFARELSKCDALIVQATYASARGDGPSGPDPAEELVRQVSSLSRTPCVFAQEEGVALALASLWLQERWLCITMGAGNNRSLCERIAHQRRSLS
ncbi:MAG: hypothetical protein GX626_05660 [Spirochaetales bacterium]|nr:hypothetical protein [Spirochaetales bacterium]